MEAIDSHTAAVCLGVLGIALLLTRVSLPRGVWPRMPCFAALLAALALGLAEVAWLSIDLVAGVSVVLWVEELSRPPAKDRTPPPSRE